MNKKIQDVSLLIGRIRNLQGSVIDDLFFIMAEGIFIDHIHEIEEGDVLFPESDMSFIEKSLLTLIFRYFEESLLVQESQKISKSKKMVVSKRKLEYLTFLTYRKQCAIEILTSLIRERLMLKEGEAISIRKGFKIVKVPQKKKPTNVYSFVGLHTFDDSSLWMNTHKTH